MNLIKVESEFNVNLQKTHKILTGIPTVELHLEFLLRNNHTDFGVLNKVKVCGFAYSFSRTRDYLSHASPFCTQPP